MNFFYLRHHFQSIVRSKSFSGEVVAFLFLLIVAANMSPVFYNQLDLFAEDLGKGLNIAERSFEALLIAYVLFDLTARIVLKRPFPKVKYYLLLRIRTKSISWQYLLTSMFGIVPFLLLIPLLTVAVKANQLLGVKAVWIMLGMFLCNHFIGLFVQFSAKWFRLVALVLIALSVGMVSLHLVPVGFIIDLLFNPIAIFLLLLVSCSAAFLTINERLKRREFNEGSKFSLIDLLPVVNFKNPMFRLEWALIIRNKRTRSNLLMGMVAVMFLPFLLDDESSEIMLLLVFLICTSFFIIQHGVYSLGWEGSYFDFLVTNVSIRDFLENRYVFYVATCITGFILCLIPAIANKLDLILLVNMFLYNIGVTIPLVLYRSVFNSTKIELSENSFMNYNGMMTGPIFLTSFLVMLMPFFFYGIGQPFLGGNASYILGGAGIVGLLARPLLLNKIINFFSKRKYHLSQSFKS